MDGIINLLKPTGMTSHDAVAAMRRLVGQKRIGHAGTLDPGAAGVLPLFLGSATRLISYMPGVKSYRAEMTLGIATQTQDASGETTEVADNVSISPNQLAEAFATFLGEIWQTPPMVSAVRLGGRRLYELARAGIEVEREPRLVRIHELHIRKVWPEDAEALTVGSRVLFDVRCSAGTYVRTLCVDVAAKLGCPAHMSFLVRTAAGPFDLADAVTFTELQEAHTANRLAEYILPPQAAVPHLPVIQATPDTASRISHGEIFRGVCTVGADAATPPTACVHDATGRLIALARPVADKPGFWQPERVFSAQ